MRIISVILISLFLGSCGSNKRQEVVFPKECRNNCVTNYGDLLGEDITGVKAYSNCQNSCVVWDANKINGVYSGIKWQCVEYSRRWLIKNKKKTYGSVDFAYQIWSKIDFYTDVKTEEKVPVYNRVNGSSSLPLVGDLLIYSQEFHGTGHVAVVVEIDKNKKWIKVGEENYSNSIWKGNFARKIKVVKSNGFWLLDKYLIGWKTQANHLVGLGSEAK